MNNAALMKIWAIAFNTFRENIRDKILYNLLVFAVIMIGLSIVLGELTIAEQRRITVDAGLTSISVFGILMAVFLGISLVSKEIERKTIYTLIAKPAPRSFFIIGRFLGLMITIGVNVAIMAVAFFGVLIYLPGDGPTLTWPVFQAILLIYLELAIITSVAMAFSTFSTPTLSAIFTLCFVIIGRLTEGILQFSVKSDNPFFRHGAEVLYAVVPNLTNYVQIEYALYNVSLPLGLLAKIVLTGLLTISVFLAVAMIVFQRRDFV